MTFYRQLLIFIILIFITLFSGSLLVKLNITRSFLEHQLESHSQDTATSLGLSISPHLAKEDMAIIETMMNAIFDSGYYQTILLTDIGGKKLVEKHQEIIIENVPQWFINRLPLSTPTAESIITSGWKQAGYLYVTSNPGYAHASLWRVVIDMGTIFLVTAVVAMLIIIPILRMLFRPLNMVEKQAEALCERQYTIQETLPLTRELRRVVIAMNTMVEKVKQMFDNQSDLAENMRKSAYSDDLTGLGNRRFLESQIKASGGVVGAQIGGAFLMVETHDLLKINQKMGYQSGDLLLRKSAEVINGAMARYVSSSVARLSGGTFGVLLPDATEDEATIIAQIIADGFAELATQDIGFNNNIGNIGGICYREASDPTILLGEADRVLRAAQNDGPNSFRIECLTTTSSIPQGEQEFLTYFKEVLAEKSIFLVGQRVYTMSENPEILHLELFSRISTPGGEILNGDTFIPLAERLDCINRIDKIVIEKTLSSSRTGTDVPEIAINISPSSLKDSSFTDWIYEHVKKRSDSMPRLIFEFAEFAAIKDLQLVVDFAEKIRKYNCDIGIDHFAKSFHNFGYLNSLLPKYVKIDRAYTHEIGEKNSDSLFFVRSLIGVAHSLDILVIAECVENEEQFNLLREIKVDAVQGYYLDKPRKMKNWLF